MDNEEQNKLQKLKSLLSDAVQQIRKKLDVVEKFILSLKDIDSVNNDTKLICTLLIEVKELLKNFPAIYDQPREELASDLPRFERFQCNVVELIEDVRVRLYSVEEFFQATDSLPKAMTVAVTIRDITKHLKVVSSRGPRIVNLPRDNSNADPAHSPEISTSVVDIVQYYTSLEKGNSQAGQLTARSTSIHDVAADMASSSPNLPNKHSDIVIRPRKKRRRRRRMTIEEAQLMDHAVTEKMSTLSKNRAELFQNMLNQSSMKTIFDEETAVKKAAIVRYLDASKLYRSGYLRKQTYTVKNFGKSWKTYWWILDSEHLSCFQSQKASLPLKSYRLDEFVRCSWEGKLTKATQVDSITQLSLISQKADRKLVISAQSPKELMAWAAAIDSVQTYKEMEKTILNPIEKHLLLQWVYQEEFKGGEIKSSYDEEWELSPTGVLKSVVGIPVELAYRWDGEMLIGLNEISANLGSGKWDGVSLVWYDEAANGVITTPSIRYDWDCQDREYTNPVERHQAWVWSRNFLVSKFGAGEWIVEGVIPEPVVMFLQMMRTSRLQRMVEAEHEANVYSIGSATFDTPSESAPLPPSGVTFDESEIDVDGKAIPVVSSELSRRTSSDMRSQVGLQLQAPAPDLAPRKHGKRVEFKKEEAEKNVAEDALASREDKHTLSRTESRDGTSVEEGCEAKITSQKEGSAENAKAADEGASVQDTQVQAEESDQPAEETTNTVDDCSIEEVGMDGPCTHMEDGDSHHDSADATTVMCAAADQNNTEKQDANEEDTCAVVRCSDTVQMNEDDLENDNDKAENPDVTNADALEEENTGSCGDMSADSTAGSTGEKKDTESGEKEDEINGELKDDKKHVRKESKDDDQRESTVCEESAEDSKVSTVVVNGVDVEDNSESHKATKKHRRRKSKSSVRNAKKRKKKAKEGSESTTWAARLYSEDERRTDGENLISATPA